MTKFFSAQFQMETTENSTRDLVLLFGITDVDDDDVCDCVFVRIDNGGGDGVGVDKWTTKFDFLVDKKVAGGGGGGGGGGGIGIEVKGCF
ncbi:hypothetical protein DERF_000094 [Dermatophagoides farinae]|uniref:Uncharacterized protein n=1 Tax=Dermatophagoides farinae TaxID=6954 RepID=A0A922I875_DERFA|nr:hypothetical protein DERF_000094 [Dermatophagoides farinae]